MPNLKLFTLLLFLGKIKSDQPVSCLGQQEGSWNFHISQDVETVSLYEAKEVCTHALPNKLQIMTQQDNFKFDKEEVWTVKLNNDMSATVNGNPAKWLSFFDQAMKVDVDEETRLLVNYRYSVKEYVENNPLKDGVKNLVELATDDYDKFYSQCDRTMVGFVQRKGSGSIDSHKVQCFYAVKTEAEATDVEAGKEAKKKADEEAKAEAKENAELGLAQISQPMGNRRFKSNVFEDHVPSEETDLQIMEINSQNLPWKANSCMLSKFHPKRDSKKCEGSGLNLAQTSSSEQAEAGEHQKALLQAQSWSQLYDSPDKIPDEKLPEAYDFRNIDGHDLTGPVRNQLHCGSCHTLSFLQSIEARLNLQGANKVQLSPQQLLACNYLNEGCEGGWSMFNGFFAENGHLVSEQCAPYKGSTRGDHCRNYSMCPAVAKVEDSYYIEVSNTEDHVNEQKIMKEMLRNGPVVGEFKAPAHFKTYESGILVYGERPAVKSNIQTAADNYIQLDSSVEIANQNLDHSVMLMGWGVDKETKMKYWIARNTFGPKWGDKGDFYIRRGENDFGIESEVNAYTAKLV